jgi:GNAT superfamily N-acetyltransferase
VADALTVRLAEPRDEEQWLALWHGWQAHMGGRVPAEISAKSWQRIVEPGSDVSVLMAFDGETALGFCLLSRTYFAWTGEDILFLQDFFVDERARGLGTGTALLEAVFAYADTIGAPQVFWMVDEDDPELQGFYQKRAVRTPYHRYMRLPWPW